MDFSKLSANEKLAVYGSIAALVGGIVGGTVSALGWIALLAALAMLAVVFVPQFSPSTRLPGSKGSLMLICGAIAGIIMVLGLLTIIGLLGFYFEALPINAIFFLVGVVGAVVMAWAGWQEFQAEGGKLQLGSTTPAGTGTTTQAPPPAADTSAPPPAADTSAPPPRTEPAAPPATAEPTSTAPPPAASETGDRPTGAERDDTGDNRVG